MARTKTASKSTPSKKRQSKSAPRKKRLPWLIRFTFWLFGLFTWRPIRWILWGSLIRKLITLLLLVPMIEPFSGSYHLAQAVYWEARDEPQLGRQAVAASIFNRVRDPNHPNSVYAVVRQQTGNVCQYSYRCEGRSVHIVSYPTELWATWYLRRAESLFYYVGYQLQWLSDPSEGATFYRNPETATSGWYNCAVKNGRLVPTVTIGLHDFHRLNYSAPGC